MSPEQRQQIKQFMEEAEKDKERQRQLLKNQRLMKRESTNSMDVVEIEDEDIPSSSINYLVEDLKSLTKGMEPDPLIYNMSEQE